VVVCPVEALLCLSLGVVSILAMDQSHPHLDSMMIAGERLRVNETDAKWTQRCHAFILLLVILWTLAGPIAFLGKGTSKCLLQK
jgi:ABC-type Mn2+/Zn2+ transport system permease subunit